MTPQELWRTKSNEDLLAASNRIGEYTTVGQEIIIAELRRRSESGLISDVVSGDAPDVDDSHRAADRSAGAPAGVIVSLWRGDVPLRQTYWVCGVLTKILLRILVALAVATNVPLLVLLVVVLDLIYSVFIMVAIWRSAGRYTGNRIWGDLARTSIALVLIRTVATVFPK